LQEKNLNKCWEYVEGGNKLRCRSSTVKYDFNFIFADNEIFFSLLLEEDDIFYAVLLYIGPAENAAKYKHKDEFVNKDDTEGVTVMHLTRRFDEKLSDSYNSCKRGNLHYDVVSRLRGEMPKLIFEIEIHRGDD